MRIIDGSGFVKHRSEGNASTIALMSFVSIPFTLFTADHQSRRTAFHLKVDSYMAAIEFSAIRQQSSLD
jgi:hypothetical protein